MKIAIRVLKIIVLILTSIWGIIFGIFAPYSIMTGDIVDPAIANHIIVVVWMLNSIICYITGTVLLMLNLNKIALIFHTVGLIVSLVIYGTFQSLYEGQTAQNPAQLYMPIVFVTILTLAIAIMANWNKIDEKLKGANANKKDYKPAPSIVGGTYEYKAENKKSKKGKK